MNQILSNITKFTKEHSTTILTVGSVIGLGVSNLLSGKAAIKIHKYLDSDISKNEKRKKILITSMAPTLTIIATGVCIVGSEIINKKRQSELTAAYLLLQSTFSNYRNKVASEIGEPKEAELYKKAEKETINPDEEEKLYWDVYSERYFKCSPKRLLEIENQFNHDLAIYSYASFDDFYDAVGLPPADKTNPNIFVPWGNRTALPGLNDYIWCYDYDYGRAGYTWMYFKQKNVVLDDGLEVCQVTPIFESPIFAD